MGAFESPHFYSDHILRIPFFKYILFLFRVPPYTLVEIKIQTIYGFTVNEGSI